MESEVIVPDYPFSISLHTPFFFLDSLRRLGVDTVDVFFVEYLNPKDDVDALLAQGGLYAALWNLQQGEAA